MEAHSVRKSKRKISHNKILSFIYIVKIKGCHESNVRHLTRQEWRSPLTQLMKPCSSMWTEHLEDWHYRNNYGLLTCKWASDSECRYPGERCYLQTCFWAHVRSPWGGSWSLTGPVCHIAAGCCPGTKQPGSEGQRIRSDRKHTNISLLCLATFAASR